MVTVFSGARTTPPESCLHLTLSAGPGHTLATLLTRKAADRIPAANIAGNSDCGDDDDEDGENGWQGSCRDDVIHQAAQDLCHRGWTRSGAHVRLGHEREEG